MTRPGGGGRAGASTSRGAPTRGDAGGGARKSHGRMRRAFARGVAGGRGGKRAEGSSDEDEDVASDEDAFEDVAEASDFDDEEIDEDEAFNDDDDMKYGELFDGGDEGEDEFDDDEEDDLDGEDDEDGATAAGAEDDEDDDLAQLMDSDADEDEVDDPQKRENANRAKKLIAAGARGAEEEDQDEDEEDLEALLDSEDDGEEDETREQMLDDIVGERKTFKRDVRYRPVRNELMAEDPLALPPRISEDAPKMTLKDLMATLGEDHLDRETVKRLTKISKSKAQDVPLAPRIQQRVERKVAYEETAKDITKYQPIVKENREKRTLKFEPPRKDMHRKETLGALVADFTPRSELEKEIAKVLKDSGHGTGKDAARGELLEMNELAVEDVQARQAKLAKMRAVLFYHEQKAKRLKAIKSKTFHRHNRKGELKVIGDGDSDEEGEGDTPEERREYLRAQERALLRHKNTSRWAQRAIKKGIAHLPGTREIMQEQLRIGQQLKQKIEGARTTTGDDDSDSTDAEDSDGDDAGADDPVAERKRRLKAKAAAIKAMEDGEAQIEGENESLFKLPFMARAMHKKKAATAQEAQELLKELDRMENDGADALSDSDSDEDDDEWNAMTARAKRASDARQTSVSKKARRVADEGDEGDSDDDVLNDAAPAIANEDDDVDGGKNKRSSKSAPVKRTAPVKELSKAARNMRAKAAARAAPPKVHRPKESDDDDDDENNAPTVMLQEEMPLGMNNTDLMRRAFADDDIEAEFEKEKLADIDAELPNVDAPKNLPGWGAWGSDQRVPKWMKDAEKKAKAEKAKALKNRKDAKLKHVIISEKYDKKAAAFNVESLPHGFASKAVYEGTMRHPLGLDTNTDAMFSKLNAPKVLKATGAIIKPLKLPKNTKKPGKGKTGKR